MTNKGGYRHGMFTLRVPPDIAVRVAQIARLYDVSPEKVMLDCIRLVDNADFLPDVLDYPRQDASPPQPMTSEK